MAEHYAAAGVSLEAGYKSVELIKEHVKKTMRPEVLGGLGGFSGAFSLSKIKDMEEPVLLSGTDGCGTKVKLAMVMNKHDTIGIDAVAMCVNDIACAGGEPLFFLDYIACGKNYPEKIASIVKGVAEGCLQSEAALIGGETAEHPGLMPEDEYDLAGFAVGVCDKKDMITGEDLKAGDVLIGMASTGVHSNGFSLVRKVFEKELTKEGLDTYYDVLGKTLGEALLAPTRIYVKALKNVKNAGVTVKACSHITGGGFYENIPRSIPDGLCAKIDKGAVKVLPIFDLIAKTGNIPERDMFNTYNMGVGMTMIVAKDDADKALAALDYAEKMIPSSNVPYDWANGAFQMAEAYYQLGQTEKANKIIDELANKSLEYMVWYLSLTDYQLSIASENFMYNAGLLDAEVRLMEKYKSEDLAKHYSEQLDQLYSEYVARMKGK